MKNRFVKPSGHRANPAVIEKASPKEYSAFPANVAKCSISSHPTFLHNKTPLHPHLMSVSYNQFVLPNEVTPVVQVGESI